MCFGSSSAIFFISSSSVFALVVNGQAMPMSVHSNDGIVAPSDFKVTILYLMTGNAFFKTM
jgi:hypothetical protein